MGNHEQSMLDFLQHPRATAAWLTYGGQVTLLSYGVGQGRMVLTQDLEQNGFGEKYRTPRAFVVDREGIVRSREYGGKTPHYFQKFLAPILAQ